MSFDHLTNLRMRFSPASYLHLAMLFVTGASDKQVLALQPADELILPLL